MPITSSREFKPMTCMYDKSAGRDSYFDDRKAPTLSCKQAPIDTKSGKLLTRPSTNILTRSLFSWYSMHTPSSESAYAAQPRWSGTAAFLSEFEVRSFWEGCEVVPRLCAEERHFYLSLL